MSTPKDSYGLPKTISLIALDIDGTILDSHSRLPTRVAAAIGQAAASGRTLLPATGRQLNAIPKEVLALDAFRYVIAANGAKLYDLTTEEVLLSDCFTKATALSVLEDALTVDALVGVYTNGLGYSQKRDIEFLRGSLSPQFFEYYNNTRLQIEDLPAFVAESTGDIEKFTLHFADMALREETREAFSRRKDIAVTSSAPTNLEFNTPTASKGNALLKLAERLSIPREGVLAMGDSLNDAAMLQAAGYAVAMGNAPDEIKALAHTIAPTNDEDGVAVILESLTAQ